MLFAFFVFDQKTGYLDLFEYAEFNCAVHFFCLDQKYSLKKFGQKMKLKFGDQNYLKMQNSMGVFTFSLLDQTYPFWPNLVQKIKIVSYR